MGERLFGRRCGSSRVPRRRTLRWTLGGRNKGLSNVVGDLEGVYEGSSEGMLRLFTAAGAE
jgi:hypothetical protein